MITNARRVQRFPFLLHAVELASRVRLSPAGAPDVAFTCKSWRKTAGGTNKDSHFSGEVSTSSSRAQNRATLVYYLPMLRGHAPLTLPIFRAVQKWISRRWILPPAVVAPGDFEGSKRDLKVDLGRDDSLNWQAIKIEIEVVSRWLLSTVKRLIGTL